MSVTLLGIRHHGPGSCRHVMHYLQKLKPDLILLEAPVETEEMFSWVPSVSAQNFDEAAALESERKAEEQKQKQKAEKSDSTASGADNTQVKSTEQLLYQVLGRRGLLHPPVAMLCYQSDDPANSAFYPFAQFSPEWQTISYAQEHQIPVRAFDLPLSYSLAIRAAEIAAAKAAAEAAAEADDKEDESAKQDAAAADAAAADAAAPDAAGAAAAAPAADADEDTEDHDESECCEVRGDPFDALAEIEGLEDGEQWWERHVEQVASEEDLFTAIEEAVTALREAMPEHSSQRDLLREAWMRKVLRAALKEQVEGTDDAGNTVSRPRFERIAVVCGAWHVPALAQLERYKIKDDNALIKTLPKPLGKNKVTCTWVPWTYARLSYGSGYGAGITSPGWYDYMFRYPDDDGSMWLTHTAQVLRNADFDVSAAHVLEMVRLSQTLAAMRQRRQPNLEDFNEAVTAIVGMGDSIVLKSVVQELIVGHKIGFVPDGVPQVPLIADIEATCRHLRINLKDTDKTIALDLRKPLDLERSVFFNRMQLLNLKWVVSEEVSGMGTFKEQWRICYEPEHMVRTIERAAYGNTLKTAVQNYVVEKMADFSLSDLTTLLYQAIPCDLPELVAQMIRRLDELTAVTSDTVELINTVGPLCQILRYGTVRDLDFTPLHDMLVAVLIRVAASGLLSCININDETADALRKSFNANNLALQTLNDEECNEIWHGFIEQVQTSSKVHPLLAGCVTRLLRDNHVLDREQLIQSISFFSSVGNTPMDMALWFDGFLENSGTILLFDDELWMLVNSFIAGLDAEDFVQLLPMLRRTFSTFEHNERYKLGVKAKNYDPGNSSTGAAGTADSLTQQVAALKGDDGSDTHAAASVIPLVCAFFGVGKAPAFAGAAPAAAAPAAAADAADAAVAAAKPAARKRRSTRKAAAAETAASASGDSQA